MRLIEFFLMYFNVCEFEFNQVSLIVFVSSTSKCVRVRLSVFECV